VNASALTAALFGACLACGVIASQRVSRYPSRWPRAAAVALRLMLGLGVFLSVWTCSTDLLWRLGVPLRIGAIEHGRMGETWWTAPVCLAWSVWIYWELRRSARMSAPR
jgi:hypothetical protein